MQVDLNTIVTVLTFLGGLIGVWTTLNNRLTKLESRLQFGDERFQLIDRRFDEMIIHLRRMKIVCSRWLTDNLTEGEPCELLG